MWTFEGSNIHTQQLSSYVIEKQFILANIPKDFASPYSKIPGLEAAVVVAAVFKCFTVPVAAESALEMVAVGIAVRV